MPCEGYGLGAGEVEVVAVEEVGDSLAVEEGVVGREEHAHVAEGDWGGHVGWRDGG